MKLMIVGGGEGQLNAIMRARSQNFTVVVSDINPECPGAMEADRFVRASTFSCEETLAAALKEHVDAVMTLGTDQPVLPVAWTASHMGLPAGISIETARAVTNKRIMKPIFTANEIPTCKFGLLSMESKPQDLAGFHFPLVVKPVDSQGQRGVYRVETWREIEECLPDVLSYSREKEVLVEEFYQSEEITVSGWGSEGRFYPLTITDRVTRSNGPHIGVCTSHEYPSKYLADYGKEIVSISMRIVSSFAIKGGPVYIQMLIGDSGIMVNEVAARIGGAYEDEFIPAITGVDILDLQFQLATAGRVNDSILKYYDFPSPRYGSVILFFTNPGEVASNGDMNAVKRLPGVIGGKYLLKPGFKVANRENSTTRAGYVAIEGTSREEMEARIKQVHELLEIRNLNNDNMLCEF